MTKELIEAIAYEDIMSDVQVSARIAARGRIWHAMNDLGYIPTPEAVKVIRAAAFGGLRDALAALREQPSEASPASDAVERPSLISEGYAVLREACRADQRKAETWPRISPGEARQVVADLRAARAYIAALEDKTDG